ncbi:MAG: kinetochore-associated Ndc80 complex subunit spc25 [Thelocarpon impressellum]|nr:MAG: kinetochore-associated Ndc80 complex subunit spc25 [Thelocarpon impressellum]
MSATLFEPSLSVGTLRPPLTSTTAPSMADSLPSINFGFEELRDRMARFTTKFDDFIEQGRKRVLEERNQFRMNVTELHEDQRMKKKDIEILSLKASGHAQTIQKEAQETAEMHAALAAVETQRSERAATRDRLKTQIAETQRLIAQRQEAQRQHAQRLDAQAHFNAPELDFWQDYLCLRIEGAGVPDRLKFVYTHADERDWEREAWFELGMGRREYEVLHCRPKVEPEELERALDKLNESRDLGVFLKGMRELLVKAMR